jgi:hypothetical protein
MSIKKICVVALIFLLASCGESDEPLAPDLSNLNEQDKSFYTQTFNRCDQSKNNCHCVAKIMVDHRAVTYQAYVSEYATVHKPALNKELEELEAKLKKNIIDYSDERVIQSIEEDLDRLKAKISKGILDIGEFEMPEINPAALSHCLKQ